MSGRNAYNAHCSEDDNDIFYLLHNKGLCQFHRVTFMAGVAQSPKS